MTATGSWLDDRAFCLSMLPKVSRTFAVCIRLLPPDLERSVLVAYLLCRIADTFEDTPQLVQDARERALRYFADCLDEGGPDGSALRDVFPDPSSDDQRLVAGAASVVAEYRRLPSAHRAAIRPWVQEMCDGMAEFAARKAAPGGLRSLGTVEELELYCYYVAGTVGQLLTRLFHLRHGREDRSARLRVLATSFGLGLQLTNIIKDVGDDRIRGWSFVPRQLCERMGIRPEDLPDRLHDAAGRQVMALLIGKAKRHLRDALEYSLALPRRELGIRRFCLTSLYFAVRTLRVAERDERLLDPTHKVKITRAEVVRTVRITRLIAGSNLLVRGYFRLLAGAPWPAYGVAPGGG